MSDQTWYRYEDVSYAAPVDEFDNPIGQGSLEVHLRTFPVLKTTEKGVWLGVGLGYKRFVLKGARKRFACPTRQEARASFMARKRAQIRILSSRLRKAQEAIARVENEVFA